MQIAKGADAFVIFVIFTSMPSSNYINYTKVYY